MAQQRDCRQTHQGSQPAVDCWARPARAAAARVSPFEPAPLLAEDASMHVSTTAIAMGSWSSRLQRILAVSKYLCARARMCGQLPKQRAFAITWQVHHPHVERLNAKPMQSVTCPRTHSALTPALSRRSAPTSRSRTPRGPPPRR